MVISLLMVLFLALVSLCLWVYARVLLTAAAADAARHVANADVPGSAAAARVAVVLAGGPAAGVGASATCSSRTEGVLVAVTCTMDSPGVLGLLDGVLPSITVTGHSVEEAVDD